MTTAFSDWLEQGLLGHTLLGSSLTAPSSLWLSLATSVTSDGGSVTEVTTNIGYSRQLLTGKLSAPTSGPNWSCVTSETITWSAATSAWGTVSYCTVVDTATIGAGNVWYWGAVDTPRAVATGDVIQFSAGGFYIRLS